MHPLCNLIYLLYLSYIRMVNTCHVMFTLCKDIVKYKFGEQKDYQCKGFFYVTIRYHISLQYLKHMSKSTVNEVNIGVNYTHTFYWLKIQKWSINHITIESFLIESTFNGEFILSKPEKDAGSKMATNEN